MAIFFIPQELLGIEIMLPNRIDRYIVQILLYWHISRSII